MLDQITPVILTFNEAPNIERALDRLGWARDIVLVDSHSTDETLELVKNFATVRVFQRPFASHEDQWSYAINETKISTAWVLRLDADYMLTDDIIAEMSRLDPAPDVDGYRARFIYCVHGRALRRSMYPPRIRLFRRHRVRIYPDGHTEGVAVTGRGLDLRHPIRHDDRKSLSRWITGQDRYMELEAAKITDASYGPLNLPDRIRRHKVLAPFVVFFYCLFGKGLIFDGLPGL